MKALSLAEKKFIYKNWIQSKETNQWIKHTKKAKEIQKLFQEKSNRHVCINTIIKHGLGFLKDEQTANKKTGRPCYATTVLKREKALEILEENSGMIRQRFVAEELGILRTSLRRIYKEIRVKGYKQPVAQFIPPTTALKRVTACQCFLKILETDPSFI